MSLNLPRIAELLALDRERTQGRWRVGMQSGHNANTIFSETGACEHDEPSICSVYGIPLHTSLEDLKATTAVRYIEPLANAELIAAAPELAEHLRLAVAEVERLEAIVRTLMTGDPSPPKPAPLSRSECRFVTCPLPDNCADKCCVPMPPGL